MRVYETLDVFEKCFEMLSQLDCKNFDSFAYLLGWQKTLRGIIMLTYSNANAKVKNWIFDVEFPENWFGFGIILNDFWSFTIWAIQIQVSITELQNLKNNLIMNGLNSEILRIIELSI